jgi:ribulose-phosphate 3-epimerase
MIEIVPSILSADFARLGEQIACVERAGARMLHLDVMDGHFVPNITIGPPVVASIRRATKLELDVHLMIEKPERHIPSFVEAGANLVSVHQETCPHLDRTLRSIQELGARAGVALNPTTPLSAIEHAVEVADFVLLMTVNPGFGGQSFIPWMRDKIRALDRMRRERRLELPIEIDGGVTSGNVAELARDGAEWIVAGSSVFAAEDPAAAVAALTRSANSGREVRV